MNEIFVVNLIKCIAIPYWLSTSSHIHKFPFMQIFSFFIFSSFILFYPIPLVVLCVSEVFIALMKFREN